MGHYWSEMGSEPRLRHPTPAEALGFVRVDAYGSYKQYYHKPCLQVFFFYSDRKLPDAIYRHAKECP